MFSLLDKQFQTHSNLFHGSLSSPLQCPSSSLNTLLQQHPDNLQPTSYPPCLGQNLTHRVWTHNRTTGMAVVCYKWPDSSSMLHLQNKLLAAPCLCCCARTSIQDQPGELLSQSPSARTSYPVSNLALSALLPCVYGKPKLLLAWL